jgi:hypothetical protein
MFKEELALALFSGFGIAAIPAFLIFLDYHKPSNIHKAVLFVFALFATGAAIAAIPARHLLVLALCIPFVLFVYVAVAKRR